MESTYGSFELAYPYTPLYVPVKSPTPDPSMPALELPPFPDMDPFAYNLYVVTDCGIPMLTFPSLSIINAVKS